MGNLLYFAALIIFYSSNHVKGKYAIVKSVEKCPVENPPDMEIELVTVNDVLVMNMKASYDYDIDDNYILHTNLYKLKNGNWEPQLLTYEDKWCTAMLNIEKAWSLAKAEIKPPLLESCLIPAGDYNLKEFQVSKEDVASLVENMDPGKYKADIVLVVGMEPDKEEVLCVSVEYDVKE